MSKINITYLDLFADQHIFNMENVLTFESLL